MRTLRAAAVASTSALVLAACGGGSGDAARGGDYVDGATFTMVLGADPGNLDPHFTSLSVTWQVDRFLYDSLLNVDANGGLVAGLAQEWRAGPTEVTFTLRDGVTCADGSPLTATTVADNVNFVGDPNNASSRLGVSVPTGATATADAAAGRVTVTSPTPQSFLARTIGTLPIVCDSGMRDRELLRQGSAGTGMFRITEVVPGDHYTLTRRREYAWGPGDWQTEQRGLPDTVVLRVVGNETTSANLLVSGQVNAVALAGPDQRRLQEQQLFRRDVSAMLGELWFNERAGLPAADEQVRRALTQAMDLAQLTAVVTGGTGEPATSLVPPGITPCEKDTFSDRLPAFDVAAARSALDAAGWPAGPDGARARNGTPLALTLYFPTELGPTMQATAELIRGFWNEVGVDTTLRGATTAEINQAVFAGQGSWDAVIAPLNVAVPSELVPFFSGPTPPDGTNFAGIDNPEYLAAVERASAIPGTDACAEWAAAEVALVERADIVPFAFSNRPTFGNGATFELSDGGLAPTSVRMLG